MFSSNNDIREIVMEIQKNQVEMMKILHTLQKEMSLISKREATLLRSSNTKEKNGHEFFLGLVGSFSSSSDEESPTNEDNNLRNVKESDKMIKRKSSSQFSFDGNISELPDLELSLKPTPRIDDITKSFQKFVLLTVDDDESLKSMQAIGQSIISPFVINKAKICDRFPRVATGQQLSNGTLSSFCLPLGLNVRVLPCCVLGRARELGWIGRKADKYAVHSFQDSTGNRTYGISITVTDEADVGHRINIEALKYDRKIRLVVNKIICVWRKYRARRYDINEAKRFLGGLRASLLMEVKTKKKINEELVLELASESYKAMVLNSNQGDALIVQKSYILLGTHPNNHSLLFSGLQKLIEHEDEMRRANDIPYTSHEICKQRSMILNEISDMILTPEQANITHPKSELDHICKKKKSYITCSSFIPIMKFTLPLPQIGPEYGLYKLILKIGLSDLLFLIEMLLLERSVLVIGENAEEVTSITFALLGLLKPYEWQSIFMPTLTEDMMDFIGSPVPFIAGMIARDGQHLEKIKEDSRVQEAMDIGLTIINLSSNKVHWTTEKEVRRSLSLQCKSARNCWFLGKLENYQKRLEHLAKDENSSLHSFKQFFQNGLSRKESVVLNSINSSVQEYLANFSGILAKSKDGFKMYGAKDKLSGERYFSASRFSKPAKHVMEYQKHFSETQILACFYDKRKNGYYENIVDKNRRYGILIANWIYFHWTLYKHKNTSAEIFASSCFIATKLKKGAIKESNEDSISLL